MGGRACPIINIPQILHIFEIDNIGLQADIIYGFQSVWSLSYHLNLLHKIYQQNLHLKINNLYKLLLISY